MSRIHLELETFATSALRSGRNVKKAVGSASLEFRSGLEAYSWSSSVMMVFESLEMAEIHL